MEKLSLSEALKGASQKQNFDLVDEDKIYYKDADELYIHPLNGKFYKEITQDNIKDLKQSILELGGITNPLTVVKHNDGKLYIISGNRRRESIKELYREGLIKDKIVPYKIKVFDTEEDELKAIILLNTQRKKSILEERNEYLYLFKFYKKEKEKYNIKGDTRTYIAKKIGISRIMLQRYLNFDNLAEDIQIAVNNGELPFFTGLEFLGIDKEIQYKIYKKLKAEDNLTATKIRLAKKEYINANKNEGSIIESSDKKLTEIKNDIDDVFNDNILNNSDVEPLVDELSENHTIDDDVFDDNILNNSDVESSVNELSENHTIDDKNKNENTIENETSIESALKDYIPEIEENINNRTVNYNISRLDNQYDENITKEINLEEIESYGKRFWLRQIETLLDVIKRDDDISDDDIKNREDCIKVADELIKILTK